MTDTGRIPAEAFPLSVFLREEMEARGWSLDDLRARLPVDPVTWCAVDLTLAVDDPNLILDADTAKALGAAFNVSPEYFMNLDRAWRDFNASKSHG